MLRNLILHQQFTKSLKRHNIYKLSLWIPEEHNSPSMTLLGRDIDPVLENKSFPTLCRITQT